MKKKTKIQESQVPEFITGPTELEDDVLEAVTGGVVGGSCKDGGGCTSGGGCDRGGADVEILA